MLATVVAVANIAGVRIWPHAESWHAGPASDIRTLRGGAELEISGKLDLALLTQLHDTLSAEPRARTVQLDSGGGDMSVAQGMAREISLRHLDTYVGNTCAGTCVVVFLAGTQRWLGPFARLDSHLPETASSNDAEAMREAVARVGGAASAVPGASDGAGLATGRAMSTQFALAGFGPAPTAESIAEAILAVPLYRAVATQDPDGFKADLALWRDTVLQGQSGEVAFDRMRERIRRIFTQMISVAPDTLRIAYSALLITEITWLEEHDPKVCTDFVRTSFAPESAFDANLVLERADLTYRVILAGVTPSSTSEAMEPEGGIEGVERLLRLNGIDPVPLLRSLQSRIENGAICPALIEVWRATEQLPMSAAGKRAEAIIALQKSLKSR